jgi:hypothetical protein
MIVWMRQQQIYICEYIYTSLYSYICTFYTEIYISEKRREACIAEATTDIYICVHTYTSLYS